MNSVERVFYTTYQTPQEKPFLKDSHDPAALFLPDSATRPSHLLGLNDSTTKYIGDEDLITSGWPWQGGIIFSDVSMRYR
jgi:hypothetical protein